MHVAVENWFKRMHNALCARVAINELRYGAWALLWYTFIRVNGKIEKGWKTFSIRDLETTVLDADRGNKINTHINIAVAASVPRRVKHARATAFCVHAGEREWEIRRRRLLFQLIAYYNLLLVRCKKGVRGRAWFHFHCSLYFIVCARLVGTV